MIDQGELRDEMVRIFGEVTIAAAVRHRERLVFLLARDLDEWGMLVQARTMFAAAPHGARRAVAEAIPEGVRMALAMAILDRHFLTDVAKAVTGPRK